jgi:ribosomal protein S27E
MLRVLRRAGCAFALGLVFLAATGPAVFAKEKVPMAKGVAACKGWCDKNNSTVSSQSACYSACEKYWLCNGSDSTASTCADAGTLAVDPTGGRANPGKPLGPRGAAAAARSQTLETAKPVPTPKPKPTDGSAGKTPN